MLVAFIAWFSESFNGLASDPSGDSPSEIRLAAGSVLTLGGTGNSLSNVSNFIAGEGARIVLKAQRGATFVINVLGDFEMSGATLSLEGGLLPADVFFNLKSTSSPILRRITGNAEFFGCILSTGKPITVSQSTINGRRISGTIERESISPLKPPPRPRGPVGP